jgi:hypothetical protein
MDSDFHWLVSWFHQRTEGRCLQRPETRAVTPALPKTAWKLAKLQGALLARLGGAVKDNLPGLAD